MSNIIAQLETEQLRKDVPDFRVGDTVVVKVRVKEGTRERQQAFEGVVIAKRNRGLNSAFTVRKMSSGEGVERVFQTHSRILASITVKRRGDVRQAKLYYLRDLTGRSARIKEKLNFKEKTTEVASAAEMEEDALTKVAAEAVQAEVVEKAEAAKAEAEKTAAEKTETTKAEAEKAPAEKAKPKKAKAEKADKKDGK